MGITRRKWMAGMAAVAGGAVFSRARAGTSATADLRINPARLRESLEGLSEYGRPAGGTFADGVSRTAFSDADVAGRKYAMELMRAAGMEPRIDAAGNIHGARAGTDA